MKNNFNCKIKLICIVLFCSFLVLFCFPLKGQNNTKLKQLSYEKQNSQILKTNPIIQNKGIELLFRGWQLGYESSMGIRSMSSYISLKYQFKFNSQDQIQGFYKLEYQPRYWTTQLMQNYFIAPSFTLYTTGDFAWGGLFGFQRVMYNRFTFEVWIGLNKTTPLENFQGNAYIRLGANFGFLIWNEY